MTYIRKDLQFYVADSVTLDVGGAAGSVVADLQVMNDGLVYSVDEVAANPGLTLRVHFVGVTRISRVLVKGYYDGSASHILDIELYNYNTVAWDVYDGLCDCGGFEQHFFCIPDDTDHMQAGAAVVRFNHPIMGNAAHDLYLDYVGLGY